MPGASASLLSLHFYYRYCYPMVTRSCRPFLFVVRKAVAHRFSSFERRPPKPKRHRWNSSLLEAVGKKLKALGERGVWGGYCELRKEVIGRKEGAVGRTLEVSQARRLGSSRSSLTSMSFFLLARVSERERAGDVHGSGMNRCGDRQKHRKMTPLWFYIRLYLPLV